MEELGPIKLKRRNGDESFYDDGKPVGFGLLSFWQWSASDIVSNATRGVLAEFIVASAVGVAHKTVREEWADWDVKAPDGTLIEVKSAAYIQSWHQNRHSDICFGYAKSFGWDSKTNKQGTVKKRHSDVYVFALLGHKVQKTLDPLDLTQWEFFVVPTMKLDERKRSQTSITLKSLRELHGDSVSYSGLKKAINEAVKIQRGL
jgi:hypothetical protein